MRIGPAGYDVSSQVGPPPRAGGLEHDLALGGEKPVLRGRDPVRWPVGEALKVLLLMAHGLDSKAIAHSKLEAVAAAARHDLLAA